MLKKFQKFLFADLDDTLFQSLEKCGTADALRPTAFLKDGSPISYTTAAQRAFIAFAQDGMTMIPATARNLDAFGRVDLPFTSYAVLDYGGIVLHPDRSVDQHWLERTRVAMHAALPGLEELAALIDAYAARTGFGGRSRVIEDFATPFYLVIKDPQKVAASLEPIEREVVQPWITEGKRDYFIHRNGNNLAVLPNALNKAHAVSYVSAKLRAEHGEILTFGMGDSKSDARFMAACDYAIVPSRTQLAGLTLEAL
jgi:hydroxymethylpyrimidine pyrophosphatase-like HAD family hydrolase